MEHRTLSLVAIVTLALGLFLAPYPSQAQSVAKTPRIGILTSASDPHPILDAFRQGLTLLANSLSRRHRLHDPGEGGYSRRSGRNALPPCTKPYQVYGRGNGDML